MTITPQSPPSSVTAAARSSASAMVIAFMASGRESVIRPMAPSRSTTTSGMRGVAFGGVETLDQLGVLLGDRLALELHRRRELVAARQPFAGEQLVALDLLDARQLRVGPPHRLGDERAYLLVV